MKNTDIRLRLNDEWMDLECKIAKLTLFLVINRSESEDDEEYFSLCKKQLKDMKIYSDTLLERIHLLSK